MLNWETREPTLMSSHERNPLSFPEGRAALLTQDRNEMMALKLSGDQKSCLMSEVFFKDPSPVNQAVYT